MQELVAGLLWKKRAPQGPKVLAPTVVEVPAVQAPAKLKNALGTQEGWLRVLPAKSLIELAHGHKAIEEMWRQSRLSQSVWERDLLPALRHHAELVQLMPASESHHHAHAGGLLAHTLEMVLAAMTWRNGHFLPESASVEDVDAQRDEWTYVVFFAALLHDVAKIMTDLRIRWRSPGMDEPLRWLAIAGSLPLVVGTHRGVQAEYLVEFTAKAERDYSSHGKLAMVLLQQIAPSTALAFLSRQPKALESLTKYLSGEDKTSLVADIVLRADRASVKNALLHGSKAKFVTSKQVALIDLLMQAMRDMLRTGTALPLNRSGAAGWVFDGSIWFVAKRLADSVRKYLQEHMPDQSVPGGNKNDRLFDTWQEHGVLTVNPQTGQSIWYVTVLGQGAITAPEDSHANYSHSLSVLRFPLDKVFAHAEQYPAGMVGRIEVKQGGRSEPEDSPEPQAGAGHGTVADSAGEVPTAHVRSPVPMPVPVTVTADSSGSAVSSVGSDSTTVTAKNDSSKKPLTAPTFNAPSKKPKPVTPHPPPPSLPIPSPSLSQSALNALRPGSPLPPFGEGLGIDGFDVEDDWLEPVSEQGPRIPLVYGKTEPSASGGQKKPTSKVAAKPVPAAPPSARPAPPVPLSAPVANKSVKNAETLPPLEMLPPPVAMDKRALLVNPDSLPPNAEPRTMAPPVFLQPFLPELPHEAVARVAEPSQVAIDFVQWLQTGLANRKLPYNESGAKVHFVPEGMALVSPAIFKEYVAACIPSEDASSHGMQVQREVIQAGWHLVGPGKVNILSYQVIGRGGVAISKLSAVVLIRPERWVMPVPPHNAVLKRI
ncbi:MAG: TraI domain-containing protein [Rhodoferax sp.]|nr:TraI domain-containing protein [Rhodoferax sp.]